MQHEKGRIASKALTLSMYLAFVFQFGDAFAILRKRSKKVLQVPFDDFNAALQRIEQPEIQNQAVMATATEPPPLINATVTVSLIGVIILPLP